MAEETKKSTPDQAPVAAEQQKVISDVPEPEPEKITTAEVVIEGEKKEDESEEKKIAESISFKEESNKVDDLIDPQKKALDEFKLMIQEALNKHEFTKKVEEKKEEETKPEEKKEEEPTKPEEEKKEELEATKPEEGEKKKEEPKIEEKPIVEEKKEEKKPIVEKVEKKVETVVEEIKETIVHEVTPPPCDEPITAAETEAETPPPPPEEVSIWGIRILADEKTDVILLKFLRARDFKVKEAFAMLKSVVAWRKEFKIDELLEEESICEGLEKAVYIHGVDKEGHLVCYNCFGEFQDKELYANTFADAEKRTKFLRWYIQFLEKNIRKLDFTPEGTCTIVQITDLKNLPGLILFKKELRQATNQALQLLQDNYPEFVAKQVFINVPWWYVAYNRMISPFLTQRTKSKFVFAGPTKTAETLFKYIAPEQVPVQYGGLHKDQEFTPADPATEEIIKPTSKHTIELPITEGCTLVWEVRVVGWDVSYEAEFVPSAEGAYTWVVQKARKIGPADENVISCTFKIGEPGKVVLTFDNQTSKKKKLVYRSKTKVSE